MDLLSNYAEIFRIIFSVFLIAIVKKRYCYKTILETAAGKHSRGVMGT